MSTKADNNNKADHGRVGSISTTSTDVTGSTTCKAAKLATVQKCSDYANPARGPDARASSRRSPDANALGPGRLIDLGTAKAGRRYPFEGQGATGRWSHSAPRVREWGSRSIPSSKVLKGGSTGSRRHESTTWMCPPEELVGQKWRLLEPTLD